jgi:hypothetical protein
MQKATEPLLLVEFNLSTVKCFQLTNIHTLKNRKMCVLCSDTIHLVYINTSLVTLIVYINNLRTFIV